MTTQTQTPEEKSKTLQDQLEEVRESLERYEEQVIGMPKLTAIGIPKWVHLDIEILKKQPIEDLATAELEINRYSLYIQRQINKEKAWKHWAESKLDEIVSYEIPKLDKYLGWNERTLIAKNSSQSGKILSDFIRKVNARLDMLSYIPSELQKIVSSITSIRLTNIHKIKTQ